MPATKKKCTSCGKMKPLINFYKSESSAYKTDGKYPVCKTCIQKKINISDTDDPMNNNVVERVKELLMDMNRPFIISEYKSAINEIKTGKLKRNFSTALFGLYYKNISLNYKHTTWNDSVFEQEDANTNSPSPNSMEDYKNDEIPIAEDFSNFKVTPNVIDKWGIGYSREEYLQFENKYHKLKNNYQEKTAMHTEALLTYIRYRVKEELATAKGEVKDAKAWGDLATRAASDAKINPSQLSKSDLSDGLDTFGQLVRSVEQAVDIIPILPKFKEKPQDKVDFTLLCYINYIRDLKGLPIAKYSDVYHFYEERKKEYEERNEKIQ